MEGTDHYKTVHYDFSILKQYFIFEYYWNLLLLVNRIVFC